MTEASMATPEVSTLQVEEQSIESGHTVKRERRSLYKIVRRCADCKRGMDLQSLQHNKRCCDDCQKKRAKKLKSRAWRKAYQQIKRNPEAWAKLQAKVKVKNDARRKAHPYIPHPLTPESRVEIGRKLTAIRDAARDAQHPRWNGESPEAVIDDPTYEKKSGVKKFVICRIGTCGKQVSSIAGHLTPNPPRNTSVHPGIDVKEYRRLFPGAPLYSEAYRKRNRDSQQHGVETKPEIYLANRRKQRDKQRRLIALGKQALAAKGDRPVNRRGIPGRPRRDEIRKRVLELRSMRKSWTQVQSLMNENLKPEERLTKDAYRSYGKNS
jgi:hypothetical protein